MTASASSQNYPFGPFGFEFAPSSQHDAELVQNLGFVPGLKELLMVRQVHALEHATVWVLSEQDAAVRSQPNAEEYGGMSTEQGFYLYGRVDTLAIRRAAQVALERLTNGEWNLAVHPRCGTNLSVGMLLTAGLAAGMTLVLPKDPFGQLMGFGLAAMAGASLAPDMGQLAQRFVTTAIPFNLEIVNVVEKGDRWGHPVHFVNVRWVQ
ncbi:DUF6391 domain-containing protein [Leptolyngbya sp. AN02str]|uniref:DUF6391 domain-containing protein n=1 Tax=Leptolyngbya sp. AN02str TaxID=3423363 RepID=UPI003D321C09